MTTIEMVQKSLLCLLKVWEYKHALSLSQDTSFFCGGGEWASGKCLYFLTV